MTTTEPAGSFDFGSIYAGAPGLQEVNGMSVPDALIWYNTHGIAAFPAHPEDKMLTLPAGYQFEKLGVLPDEHLAHVHEAWRLNPDMRVAIICGKASGLLAIDVDDLDEWEKLGAEHPNLFPPTAIQNTGREGGGFHLLYRRGDVDTGQLKQGSWSAGYPHIEVKAKGLIIAAPSLHASGKCYGWLPGPGEPAVIGREVLEARRGSLKAAYDGKLSIDCGGGQGPDTIRAVQAALNTGVIPGIYVTSGHPVIIEEVSGQPGADEGRPLPVAVAELAPNSLASMLAHKTHTFRAAANGDPSEFTPPGAHLAAALAPRSWPGLKPLNGIIGAPVLLPAGSLLQEPGYDTGSGLYLASRVQVPQVPARPSPEYVSAARDLVLNWVLADFPWVSQADRANYVAMLVTQMLRRYLAWAPVPLFLLTAPDASSGKTLLATTAGVLFGQVMMPWTDDEAELRKILTTVMQDQAGVICFDNIPEGTVIRSATLSKLLTDRTWGDRLLGGNVLARFANDRLWTGTGNNIRLGGDMRSRTVLIRIDPGMAHPERRKGFRIPDLESWIEDPANQSDLLMALLVLVADWAAAGCADAEVTPMRQFTRWARAAGGLLEHHGVSGLLGNTDELDDLDDDDADWTQFLACWQQIFGSNWVTSAQLTEQSYDPRWASTFPAGKGGELLGAKSLGRRLTGQKDRHHGMRVLRGTRDDHAKIWWWRAESTLPVSGPA